MQRLLQFWGRLKSFNFRTDTAYKNTYAYDGTGRLAQIKADHSTSTAFDYTYHVKANVVDYLQHGSYSQDVVYRSDSYRQDKLIHKWGSDATKDQEARFTYDSLGRRTYEKTSGLVYYGKRYDEPELGRFINSDPIAEEGGINLYRFVGNNPVNGLDFLGLCESEGDTDEYGNEVCHDEYVLSPFTIDGNPTIADLNIWAIQDYNTEGLIEQLIAEYSNHQNNVDTGNSLPGNGEGTPPPPKKEEKPKWCNLAKAVLVSNEIVGNFLSRLVGDDGNNLTFGGTVGLSLAVPVLGVAGIGAHAEAGAQLIFDWDDPLNSKFSFLLSGSGMFTGGGGIYMSAGPVAGNLEGEVESGISVQSHIHVEGAIATPGGGGAFQVDVGIDPNARLGDQISDVVTGHSLSVSPRTAVGIAGLAGVGVGGSVNAKSKSPKEALQKKYNEECR